MFVERVLEKRKNYVEKELVFINEFSKVKFIYSLVVNNNKLIRKIIDCEVNDVPINDIEIEKERLFYNLVSLKNIKNAKKITNKIIKEIL